MSSSHKVPVVDMSGGITPAFVREFGSALQDYGFASVVGHGLHPSLLTNVYAAAEKVFDLPLKIKKQYETPENGRQTGYTPFGLEKALGAKVPDLKEFWHIYRPGHEIKNNFPFEVLEFGPLCLALYRELDQLGLTLLGAVGAFLKHPPGFFEDWAHDGDSLLRVLHYPEIADGDVGLRAEAHGDINLITLLPAATDAGLELLTRDGVWIPINNPPNAIIVNVGEMLETHTMSLPGDFNDPELPGMPATKHRVVNLPGRRFSLPFFVHPHNVPLVESRNQLYRRLKVLGLLGTPK